ncbi:hypothetical protein M9H77_13530 [Catharanthus roseus]|uniref:Uncharacterized protein n=1 Tax=Catharanthus roseus TaxID=4058 RepID=A0ACC0BKP3_CATRO|nr:hypothetical protein M9H77_13530 [Catharanthus roseus]
MATSENWELFVHNGRHNHKIAVYRDLRRSSCNRPSSSGRVMFHIAIYYDFSETRRWLCKNFDVCNAQKIYNVVAKIKRNRIHRRNTVEEVLCLSVERGCIVFHRNREDNNVLSDIFVAHPTSIAMVQHATIRMCRDDCNMKELHSGNSFYVQ